ncbi:MAG: ABC transporter permease subunit [Candidatus Sumerlaeota bacterium]|nr:ABC transporter permease subunit [Candidatus Sumerlaeota bacterium]
MIFRALLRAEWTKTMRMRATYIAFLAVALLVILIEFWLYFMGSRSSLAKSFRAFDFNLAWIINGYTATQIAMMVAFIMLVVPMTIMTFARQVAGENQGGTLRLVLSRPISRFALINAKFLAAGRGRRGGGFWAPPNFDYQGSAAGRLVRDQVGGQLKKMLISPWQCLRRLALAWLLTSWALFTLGAIAFVYSTLNRHPIAAMALTLATFFLVFIVQQLATLESLLIPMFTTIEPYLFTKAMGYWSACFKATIDWDEIVHGLWLLGAYTLVFYALAQLIFRRRDITS